MHRFEVSGMSCDHCAKAVTRAVQTVDAAATVDIDLDRGTVDIDSAATADRLATAIVAAGYEVAGRAA